MPRGLKGEKRLADVIGNKTINIVSDAQPNEITRDPPNGGIGRRPSRSSSSTSAVMGAPS